MVCDESEVVFGPELLVLLQQSCGLHHRVLVLLFIFLELPPCLALASVGELGQLATMDSERCIGELLRIVSYHVGSSVLV